MGSPLRTARRERVIQFGGNTLGAHRHDKVPPPLDELGLRWHWWNVVREREGDRFAPDHPWLELERIFATEVAVVVILNELCSIITLPLPADQANARLVNGESCRQLDRNHQRAGRPAIREE